MTSNAVPRPTPAPAAGRESTDQGTSGRGSSWRRSPWTILAAVLSGQLLLVGLVVAPQLSPRVAGTEIQLRVAPYDPIDPFRGAYADLDSPDLPHPRTDGSVAADRGTAYVPLRQDGEVWVGGPIQRTPPDGLFLRCSARSWRIDCGINSWFASQDNAYALEQELGGGRAVATVRVDRWGNAAIGAIDARG